MADEDLIINPANDQAGDADHRTPWGNAYGEELGIKSADAPLTDAEKIHRDTIASLPHETRASSQTRENLAQLTEENSLAVRGQQWAGQVELGESHEAERMGRILHAAHFIEMLRKTGLICVYTKCNTQWLKSVLGEEMARRRREQFERSMAGLTVMGTTRVQYPRPAYATWVQIPYMIEYSVMRFDRHNVPTSEKYRGWRTVLIELVRQGHIEEADCHKIFGYPRGPAADRWNQIMQSIRNNRGVVC